MINKNFPNYSKYTPVVVIVRKAEKGDNRATKRRLAKRK